MSNKDLKLVIRVPNTDFDHITLDLAIRWVADQRAKSSFPPNPDWEDKGRHAAQILSLIADKYDAALENDKPRKSFKELAQQPTFYANET